LEHRRSLGRSPTTLANYGSKIRTIKASPLGEVQLPRLTAEHLNGFYRERLVTDSPQTVVHYHRILSAALNFAERQEWIVWNGRSPMARAEPPRVPHHDGFAPTAEQLRSLIEGAEQSRQPEMATAMRIAALTGMRRGEVCGLQWKDVDWERGAVAIRRSLYQVPGQVGVKEPKGRDPNVVELDDPGMFVLADRRVRALAEASMACVDLLDDGYVLSATEDGGVPWSPNRITQFMTRLRKRLGIPDFHFHALRRWSTTELVAAGIDIREVAGRHGHHDGGTLLLRHYAQRRTDRGIAAAKVLSEALGLTAG
jgi:integrase